MHGDGLRRVAGLAAGLIFVVCALALGACSHNASSTTTVDNPELNAPPTDYRREIVAAMHAYRMTRPAFATPKSPSRRSRPSTTCSVMLFAFASTPRSAATNMPASRRSRRCSWSGASTISSTRRRSSARARALRHIPSCRNSRAEP